MLDQNTMKAGFIRLKVILLFGSWNSGRNKRLVCCEYCGTAGLQSTGGFSSPCWISFSPSSFSRPPKKRRKKVSNIDI